MTVQDEQRNLWRSFSLAVGAEPRNDLVIRGYSGLEHPVQSIAVDDKQKRVIIVSAEQNPRIAALMRVDVQATMPDVSVLVARPVAVDLGFVARQIFEFLGTAELNFKELEPVFADIAKRVETDETEKIRLQKVLAPFTNAFEKVTLPPLSQVLSIVQQAAQLDWAEITKSFNENTPRVSIEKLMRQDNIALDREFGICAIPLYEFSEKDWELLLKGERVDDIQERLKELDIYQYFFPAPDELALGLVERGITQRENLIGRVEAAPALGHPLGEPEFASNYANLLELVELLQAQKLLVEGELGFEVSKDGATHRAQIKFKPREGAISKLAQNSSVKIDLNVTEAVKALKGAG